MPGHDLSVECLGRLESYSVKAKRVQNDRKVSFCTAKYTRLELLNLSLVVRLLSVTRAYRNTLVHASSSHALGVGYARHTHAQKTNRPILT